MYPNIDKNIPIPELTDKAGRTSELRSILQKLKIGDSVLFIDVKYDNIRMSCKRYSREGKKFIARKNKKEVRIWRVE